MKNNIVGQTRINLHAPIRKVWDALTKPELIKQYFFGTNTKTDWKPGRPIRFSGEWEGKSYEDKGTVLDFIPYKRIVYDYWSSMSGIEDKPENYVIITFELSGEDNNVDLTIIQENIPDERTKVHSIENWNKVLQGLKHLVEEKTSSFA
jgi:uncharacterized protein YndB with AHSA1/START domain